MQRAPPDYDPFGAAFNQARNAAQTSLGFTSQQSEPGGSRMGRYINIPENIPQDRQIEEYIYHQVSTDGRYTFDPRLYPEPLRLGDYERLIQGLNPGEVIIRQLF